MRSKFNVEMKGKFNEDFADALFIVRRVMADNVHRGDEWTGQSVDYHVKHCLDHCREYFQFQKDGVSEEDDLAHAALRALMALQLRAENQSAFELLGTNIVNADGSRTLVDS